MLKKEFQERDVNRMRNLITGDVTAKTGIQTGYEKQQQDYKEGDIWEERGKRWTIKNGIKQTVTKFDSIKKLAQLPLSCPECNKPMHTTSLNKKMYAIHQKCFECVVLMETRLKAEGKYEEYEKQLLNGNKNSLLDDLSQAIDDWMNQSDSFISENGEVESWSKGQNMDDVYKDAKDLIEKGKETEI